MIVALFALTAARFSAIPEFPPDPPTHGGNGFERPSRQALDFAYEAKAAALRDEMHALQAADGGEPDAGTPRLRPPKARSASHCLSPGGPARRPEERQCERHIGEMT